MSTSLKPPEVMGRVPVAFGKRPSKAKHLSSDAVVPPQGIASVASINSWVNKNIKYRPDRKDSWAEAMFTLTQGEGDCEDLAILKRAMLKSIGVASWVLIVKDIRRSRFRAAYHAVTILPNHFLDLRPNRVLPLEDFRWMDYSPKFAFDDEKTWVYGRRVG